MKVNYKYASPSQCIKNAQGTTVGFSADVSHDEKVSFLGKLKHPLVFRDAMLMLRDIVISDMRKKTKPRTDYFEWLETEIERRIQQHTKYSPQVREKIQKEIDSHTATLQMYQTELKKLLSMKSQLQKQIDDCDTWRDYNNIERKFWEFLRSRDYDLWFVLDPVITVHKDQVSFEAFSVDESTYGCLSIDMSEFDLLQQPQLGTTNIDFSAKLAREIQRFRTYTDVTLSVNPEGFTVDTDVIPEYIEKKIDLPETWIKGFNQVSAAAAMNGIEFKIEASDMYDICAFLRKHKEKKSPRYMKWILEPEKRIQIVFEPFGTVLTLNAIYHGKMKREEKIWGRRRWLVLEKLIPLAKAFHIRLLGFGMPQFIRADMGTLQMTVGFTSWSANDWVKCAVFDIMSGFTSIGNYDDVYPLLKKERSMTMEQIFDHFSDVKQERVREGIGMLFRRGEAYFDIVHDKVRFRRLYHTPIPVSIYEFSGIDENEVKRLQKKTFDSLTVQYTRDEEFIFSTAYEQLDTDREAYTKICIDKDMQISKVNCTCRIFQKGARNISEPCEHILALYITSLRLLKLKNLEYDKEYRINDIMEMLL